MVCVPCIIVPFLLWFFYKFVNPWLSKLWSRSEEYVTSNLTCPMPKKKKKDAVETNKETQDGASSNDITEGEMLKSSSMNGHTNTGERLKAE